jgi:serine/threonine protein kinase
MLDAIKAKVGHTLETNKLLRKMFSNFEDTNIHKQLAVHQEPTKGTFFIVTELVDGDLGALKTRLNINSSSVGLQQRLGAMSNILDQGAQGISELHSLGLTHGDIKAANILYKVKKDPLDKSTVKTPTVEDIVDGKVKIVIGDFDSADSKDIPEQLKQSRLGSLTHAAPETNFFNNIRKIPDGPLQKSSDFYSLATTMYGMMTGTKASPVIDFLDDHLKVDRTNITLLSAYNDWKNNGRTSDQLKDLYKIFYNEALKPPEALSTKYQGWLEK